MQYCDSTPDDSKVFIVPHYLLFMYSGSRNPLVLSILTAHGRLSSSAASVEYSSRSIIPSQNYDETRSHEFRIWAEVSLETQKYLSRRRRVEVPKTTDVLSFSTQKGGKCRGNGRCQKQLMRLLLSSNGRVASSLDYSPACLQFCARKCDQRLGAQRSPPTR